MKNSQNAILKNFKLIFFNWEHLKFFKKFFIRTVELAVFLA